MEPFIAHIDWIPTIAGAVVSYLLGWLWYSPKMFAKPWLDGVGLSLDDMGEPPKAAMTVQAIATVLLAWVIGWSFANAVPEIAVLAVATVAVFLASSGLYTQKKPVAIYIETGYIIAMAAVMVGAHIVYVATL